MLQHLRHEFDCFDENEPFLRAKKTFVAIFQIPVRLKMAAQHLAADCRANLFFKHICAVNNNKGLIFLGARKRGFRFYLF
jgi:hypothetical protein